LEAGKCEELTSSRATAAGELERGSCGNERGAGENGTGGGERASDGNERERGTGECVVDVS
jgi:hypothetical protein